MSGKLTYLPGRIIKKCGIHQRPDDGAVWKESELKARSMAQNLTVNQLHEACNQLKRAQKCENDAVVGGTKMPKKLQNRILSKPDSIANTPLLISTRLESVRH